MTSTINDPISYYLRHPMHCGVMQFLHFDVAGIVECSYYPKGLENHPESSFSMQWGQRKYDFHPDDAMPLATARKIWDRFILEGWEFREGDRSGVRMVGWKRA